jgi:trk system potassium uptake protein TrkH
MRSILAVVNVMGALVALFAAYFVLPIITALIYGEAESLRVFAICLGISLGSGLVLMLATRPFRKELRPRDGYLLVSLSWNLITLLAALPLMMGAPHLSFTNAFFESMSGLSTNGSTIITGLDALPKAVNLWRCALHWLGGMGIIVLAVAILPLLGVGGMQMYRAEMPGPVKDTKLTPRITETAKALWLVYAGLTLACTLALWAAGMPVFDAICHAFSTMSLGGFSTHDTSMGFYGSAPMEFVLMVFMIAAAINFATHFTAFRRFSMEAYRRDPEARWVVVWLAFAVVAVTAVVHFQGLYPTLGETFRHVAFSTISVATTTGLVTEDFSRWPIFAGALMLFLSCILPSTGSTGGGIKMFRALIMLKQFYREMFVLVHPAAVAPLKIAGNVVSNRVVNSVLAFVFVYISTVVVLSFALLATDMDLISAFSGVIASINSTGPALGNLGPANTFASLADSQKWIFALAMFLGRIELFTFLILFTPSFWRK